MEKPLLDLTRLGMRFPTNDGEFIALKNVDLQIQQGEFISLIGHSGCGKSTVLNLVAGLYLPTDGGVIVDGREVSGPGPDRAVVFQNHSLLPWLSVYQNVELAVKQIAGKQDKAWIKEQVMHYLDLIQMTHAADKKPDEISGGMKQRVGIARALALQPKVLLMDEPFGALDALTRAHLQDALMAIQAELNNTVIMITHDVDEAVLLSDKIVMMTNGPAATIGEVLEIDLPRPRERVAMANHPQYQHYRQSVLKFLYEKQSKSAVTKPEVKHAATEASAKAQDEPAAKADKPAARQA
ncbi:ABC transporter ATP-binding protein [Vibrio sp. SM6]|uniref:ABC transporter ATP-binding protein n=1 Tax=Vibrio agarilyticus TaxID=2726741 RepID=A0A7X8TTT1_9VIBR|nr:ABC transporter ATP-binding protein [Vibrio agarilyticus]NLS14714.1 ABC transporter ATP-binding protein [Vibrio agarilyticus]